MQKIDLTNIRTKFDQSINWNALLFVVNKSSITLISFLLFKNLTSEHYSLWANIYSCIFAVLLWADFGFRKSIPQFLPVFSKNKFTHKNFINLVIKIQIFSLTTSAFLVSFFIWLWGIFWSLPITLGFIMFFAEGPLALLRLFYHSHFLNKEFNVICSTVLFFEILDNLLLISAITNSYQLLISVMTIKIISSLLIVFASSYYLKNIYNNFIYQDDSIDFKENKFLFKKHSSVMLSTTVLKSLSERNVLIPLLTFFLGIEFANMFKVANDGALWIQRVVLKLIGTSDIALFAHTKIDCKASLYKNFNKLTAKIWTIALPLFGLLGALFLFQLYFGSFNFIIFRAFICLSIFYLIENLLFPYERLLESKFRYRTLFATNALSAIAIFCLVGLAFYFGWLSLSIFVLLLSGVRF